MGDIGNKIASDRVGLFQSRDIMEQRNHAARFPILIRNRDGVELQLLFAVGRAHLRDSRLGLIERDANWLDHVAVANDVE